MNDEPIDRFFNINLQNRNFYKLNIICNYLFKLLLKKNLMFEVNQKYIKLHGSKKT